MLKILVIEDNEMNLEIAVELLKSRNHYVLNADNAQDGINIAVEQQPDLILMDLSLPEFDGLTATKRLKENELTKDILVIAFTASVMIADKEKAFEAGCDGFISKPVDISTFADTVENYAYRKTINDIPILNTPQVVEYLGKDLCKKSNNLPLKPHKILIVEDNFMNAEILKEIICQIAQEPIIAHSGAQALKLIEHNKFDLLLLDIMMPEMSGFEVIERINAIPSMKDIPVIFVSALAEAKDIVKGLNLGSYDYITKPYNHEEMKAKILNILRIKDLQDKLKSEKNKFDLILKYSTDGIVLLDEKQNIISCNNQFLKWFRKDNSIAEGRNFCAFIQCPNSNNDNCFNKNNCKDTKKELLIELNGECKCFQVNHSVIYSDCKDIQGYVKIIRDITVEKEIEKQKETFVATLTHDLKTPIRAEIMALDLLLKGHFGKLNPDQESILQDTLCSSKYMSNMVNNLLRTYQIDNGNVVLRKEHINLNNLIKSCYSELKNLVKDKKQQVTFDFENNNTFASIDIIEIKRVIVNLLSNAINYSYENGIITISTKQKDDKIFVSFKDNGRGMSKDELKNLFTKYTSYAKKFRQVGTGLGLYLSKQIVEAHSGEIIVESEEGSGSTFTFCVPVN